jgi:hypothetical protein
VGISLTLLLTLFSLVRMPWLNVVLLMRVVARQILAFIQALVM